MAESPRILFAGGGTGGHVYPAIAIADAIRRLVSSAEIEFAGTRDKMEWEAVPKAGYEIHPITISGLHRRQPHRNLLLPYRLVRSLVESRHLVKEFDPHVAVGTGGYVSGPVLFASSLVGVPIVIQEQNAYAGLTNRMLGKRAAQIHVAFREVQEYLPAEKCVYSGNPTRHELLTASRTEGRSYYGVPEDAVVLIVFGGSLGSRAMNEAMATHVSALLADGRTFVVWQSGRRYYKEMKRRVSPHDRLRLVEYIDRMDLTYAAADLALCRAGAITCSELMVTGTPSVLVPSPNVAADHQTHNARSMEQAGAAVLLPEGSLETRLPDAILSIAGDRTRLTEMAQSAKRIGRPDAADNIARDVLAVGGFQMPVTRRASSGSNAPDDARDEITEARRESSPGGDR